MTKFFMKLFIDNNSSLFNFIFKSILLDCNINFSAINNCKPIKSSAVSYNY